MSTKIFTKKVWIILGSLMLIAVINVIVVFVVLPKEPIISSQDAVLFIDSDEDFVSYGFSGSGSENDPYFINNFDFTDQTRCGIIIANTTKYFTVRDCVFKTGECIGLKISNVAPKTATIHNNIFSCKFGLDISHSKQITITNNYVSDFSIGMNLIRCDFGLVENNNFLNSLKANETLGQKGSGIYLYASNATSVTHNLFRNNHIGIDLHESWYNLINNNRLDRNRDKGIFTKNLFFGYIINNNCTDNDYGVYIYNSTQTSLLGNSFIGGGLFVYDDSPWGYESHDIIDNRVNGKKLGYFYKRYYLKLTEPEYGQLILYNCLRPTIMNQNLSKTSDGLTLINSVNATVENNTCNYNKHNGMYLEYSHFANVTANNLQFNENGLKIVFSSYCRVFNNTAHFNKIGFYYFDLQLAVEGRVFTTPIKWNNISFNEQYGIYFARDGFNTIVKLNYFNNNGGYAIFLSSMILYVSVHHNTFITNNLGGTSQCCDEAYTPNYWYDLSLNEGNYWSEWSGIGSYGIDGHAYASDPYPLVSPPI